MKYIYLTIIGLLFSVNIYSQLIATMHSGGTSSTYLIDSLFAYYPLDDASGDAEDVHGNRDLTLINTPTQGVTGKVGDCYTFTESSDEYLVYTPTDFEFITSFSISCWFKTDGSVEDLAGIVTNFGAVAYGYDLKISALSNIVVDFRHGGDPGNTQLLIGGLNPDDDAWHHMVVTWDIPGDETKLYVDHVLRDTEPLNDAITWDAGCEFTVGKYGSSAYWNGEIDEVGIWRGFALSQGKVDSLWNSGNGLAYPF